MSKIFSLHRHFKISLIFKAHLSSWNTLCTNVTVNGKTYTNALPFNGKFRLVSVYHLFKMVHAKRLNG